MTKGILKITTTTYLKSEMEDSSKLKKEDLVLIQNQQELDVDLLGESLGHYLILWENKQYYVYQDYCTFTPIRTFAPTESCYLYLTKTEVRDRKGCYVLKLQYFKDGILRKTFDMRSGQPNKQNFRTGIESVSGSKEPLPEGRWRINDIWWANGKDNWNASHGDGVGAAFVPLDYVSPGATSRKAIGIHYDENALTGKWGSAGCPVVATLEEMKELVEVLRDGDPKYLYSDWGMGSLDSLNSPKLLTHTDNSLPQCGVDLIKQFEGCYLEAYPDPLSGSKPITIGWGSTKKIDGSEWNLGDRITQEEADNLLVTQLEYHYLPPLRRIPIWKELNTNQQGALLSFAYNLGANFYNSTNFQTITNVLRYRHWDKIRDTFVLYRNPGSNIEAGLLRRRLAEANLFLAPVEE